MKGDRGIRDFNGAVLSFRMFLLVIYELSHPMFVSSSAAYRAKLPTVTDRIFPTFIWICVTL